MPTKGDGTDDLVEWRPELGPEGQKRSDELRAKMERRILVTKQLREALGLSQAEFLAFMQKDEFEGLPPEVPRSFLSLSKLEDLIDERGGTLRLIITLDGVDIRIPD